MALIRCPECGKEISNKARACPNCGMPILQDGNQSEEASEYGIIICRKCGYSIPANHKYCDNCGEELGKCVEIIRNDSFDIDTLDKTENTHLQRVLLDGEDVRCIAKGTLFSSVGILVCTNIRLFFLNRGILYGGIYKEINLRHVNSIYEKNKLLYSEIYIETGASVIPVLNVKKEVANSFVRSVNELLRKSLPMV